MNNKKENDKANETKQVEYREKHQRVISISIRVFYIQKKKKKKKLHEIALSLSPLQRLQRFFITVDRLNIVPW